MAVVSHQDADQFLAKAHSNYRMILVFGPDQGLVFERSRKVLHAVIGVKGDGMQVVDLAGDAIAADPATLVDEANAINMFGGDARVVRIAAGARSFLPALELVSQSPASSVIIIEAGDLKRDAALRKWVEAQDFAVSIECRADDRKDIQRLIDAEIRIAQLTLAPDAREVLGAMLGEDRLSTRSELEKLTLYAHGQSTIHVEHINEILHDVSTLGVDAVIAAIFSGKPAEVVERVQKALQIGVDVNALVAALLRYALALHRCLADIDAGASFDGALQSLLRQVYGYNRKAEISSQLRQLKLPVIEQVISAVFDVVRLMRRSNALGEQRTVRSFLALANLIKKSQI
jgi:DNA polymerase-3 subunit delta